jgi:CHAT domain-containing protein
MLSRCLRRTVFLIVCSSLVNAQQPQAKELLARALHLADLYNWVEAAPNFAQAEHLFADAGDERNALYAKLGLIRSNIDREPQTLPAVAAQLADKLEDDPMLKNDTDLRLLCLIVKGDIDTETNTGAMKQDWEQVQSLASELGNTKWQYRALAQLGIAAFYDADLETARKDVGAALAAATKAGDAGAQIRMLTILGNGLLSSKMYEQALAYFENAIKLAAATPDAGYQFTAQENRVDALIGLGRLDAAQQIAQEVLTHAKETRRNGPEATALGLAADVAAARNDRAAALAKLEQAIAISEASGFNRLLADIYGQAAEIHRANGDLEKAEHFAELSSASTQAIGDLWVVPQRLQTLAEIQVARGRYEEADRVYDRAEVFLDALIGNASTLIEKTAVITASSQIYSQHFALIANQFHDTQRAYHIIEQVRGRAEADLLAAGPSTSSEAKAAERAVSQLRLKLMAARSTDEVRSLRDQIFLKEQARWMTPGASVLKTQPREAVPMEQIQQALAPSAVLLEYVIADPASYCLMISRNGSRIVRLGSKAQIEALVTAYLTAVKAKHSAISEARSLYDALVRPLPEIAEKETLIIVRDGQLNLVPFDALRDISGRYVVETRTVLYSPSASSFYLLREQKRPTTARKALLAIGGVPYERSSLNRSGLTRGFSRNGFVDLPSSEDEVRIAQAAFPKQKVDLLVGDSATEAAFKAANLNDYRVIHLAVHGFADSTFPDRAALILLSNPSAGEDGFLQASEIVQLRFDANLVVLSACDTAVGPLEGQDGIANLARAFLMAGARTVISTLWQIDDNSSLFLMKRFYAHLSTSQSPAAALTAAKRDMLRTYGTKALPYQWAAFTIEGAAGQSASSNESERSK